MSERSVGAGDLIKGLVTFMLVTVTLFGGYMAFQAAMGTSTPLLVVDGPSMLPTLHQGDYVVIKRVPPSEIEVGDIIVYHSPHEPSKLIVHRVYEIVSKNPLVLKTKGDNNMYPDPWSVKYSMIEGKVIFVIPLLGHVTLFLKNPANLAVAVLFLIMLMAVDSLKRAGKRSSEAEAALAGQNPI